MRNIAITWSLSGNHGWGLAGLHAAAHLAELGRVLLVLEEPAPDDLPLPDGPGVGTALRYCRTILSLRGQNPNRPMHLDDSDVAHALGDGLRQSRDFSWFQGQRDLAVAVFRDTRLDDAARARAGGYERIVVHSSYNRDVLAGQGITNVTLVPYGGDCGGDADTAPAPRVRGPRFVVFSGGKLEYAKGQDIVLAAFRRFRERHPEAVLVTAWHNPWPRQALGIAASRHTPVPPRLDHQGRLDIVSWAADNGVAPDGFIDLGPVPRAAVLPVLRSCDAAVFPSRCEGATNLSAMDAMACGVPVVLSANTGHADIIHPDRCLTLDRQDPVFDLDGGRIGWGESSVDELVERLEQIHAGPDQARQRAARAAAFFRKERTWRRFAREFVQAMRE